MLQCVCKSGAVPSSLNAPVVFLRRNLLAGSLPEQLLGDRKKILQNHHDPYSLRECRYVVANALDVLDESMYLTQP
eukprot:1039038-Amphidinium_carterae.1